MICIFNILLYRNGTVVLWTAVITWIVKLRCKCRTGELDKIGRRNISGIVKEFGKRSSEAQVRHDASVQLEG